MTAGSEREPDQQSGSARRETLDDYAYHEIQKMLVRLEIPPAAPIDDGDLATRIGVGRTPVRRALKRLALEGLVTIYPRRGTFATDISLESVRKLSDLRVVLEGLAAEKAAENSTTTDMVTLRELKDQLTASFDTEEELFDVFKKIHYEIYEQANNPYLARAALTHYQLSYRIWSAFQGRLKVLSTHIDFYRELVDAVLGGNGPRARELAARHVVDFREEVRSGI